MSENKPFWMPMTYTIRARTKRRQSVGGVTVRETVPVEIRVVTREEVRSVGRIVPTAEYRASWGHYSYADSNKPQTPPHPHELVQYAGVWYRPVMTPEGDVLEVDALPDHVRSFNDYPLDSRNPFEESLIEDVDPDRLHEVHGDDREEMLDQVRKAATELIVLDGVLMRPTVEPVVEVRYRGQDLSTTSLKKPYGSSREQRMHDRFDGIGVHVHADGLAWKEDKGVLFRLDEWDVACAIASKIAQGTRGGMRAFGSVEWCDPDALAVVPHGDAVTRLRDEMDFIAKTGFSSAPREAIRAWCDARDILESYENGVSEAAELIVALDRFIDLSREGLSKLSLTGLKLARERFESLPVLETDPALDIKL